jgi:hypothetical protein
MSVIIASSNIVTNETLECIQLTNIHREPPQGMVKKQKLTKSFFEALVIKFVHNYKLLLFHVYQLHALIYGLHFI